MPLGKCLIEDAVVTHSHKGINVSIKINLCESNVTNQPRCVTSESNVGNVQPVNTCGLDSANESKHNIRRSTNIGSSDGR
jgi:hypothetical protein